MEYVLEVNALSKKIGTKQIVDNISFNIKVGEGLGLIGKNGAGKTSIIKCITGLWKMNSGRVIICGKNKETDFTDAMENLAALVEYPRLFPNLTLMENINYFCSFYPKIKMTEIEEKLNFLNLNRFIHLKIKIFSSGMHQKACLLIILLRNPKLLILDEPSSMLDAKSAFEMRSLLNYLKTKKGISILISSHNLNEVEYLCDRAIVIDEGVLINNIEIASALGIKTYVMDFPDVEMAVNLVSEALDQFNISQIDNKIYLRETAEQFRNFILKFNPKFTELSIDGNLEKEFLSTINEEQ